MESATETTLAAESMELLAAAARNTREGRLDDAMAQLKRLLDIDPYHEIARGTLAGIYAQLEMYDRAIEQYRKVLEIHPENPLARFQLGLTQLQTHQPLEALETWRAGRVDDGDYLVQHFIGVALIELGRVDEARTLLDKVQKQMPQNHSLYPQLLALRKRIESL
jgi:tetratricopeptide (TPR) repeat protein